MVVSSNSHKAINNLLAKIEDVAEGTRLSFCGVKKFRRGKDEQRLEGRIITDADDVKDVFDYSADLVGGTAWLFADEHLDQQFDYLFVGEAGQVSLGHLLAMGSAARNIVLVGDQMQLSQPIRGAPPGESGLSALDYLLEGEATVPPDRGILLDTSWRMHPAICDFISEAVYDGRLKAHPDCARQRLHLAPGHDPALAECGIRFVPMEHTACGQRSDAEVRRVRQLAEGLIGSPFTARNGLHGTIGWDNILIVAPYNVQVNAPRAALPAGARVGTVDKFQGQEAEVVIVSLATSSRSLGTRRKLDELRHALAEIPLLPLNRLPWAMVRIDRTNRRWAALFRLARLLLQRDWQATHHAAKAPEGLSLLFPMNDLFEKYAAVLLRRALAGSGIEVIDQGGHRACLGQFTGAHLNDGTLFRTKPDIMLRQGREVIAIIDTKWKKLSDDPLDRKHGVSQADVYQLMAYARLYRTAELLLLYPARPREGCGMRAEFGMAGGSERLRIATADVSLDERALAEALAALVTAVPERPAMLAQVAG